MSDDVDNVVPLKKEDAPLTPAEVAAAETRGAKVKKHAKKHKKKYAAASIVALVTALLEVYTQFCPKLPGVLHCEEAKHEEAKP